MIWNILLLLLVFGSAQKKYNPYLSAAILGAVKGGLYYIANQSLIAAALGFIIFGGLGAALVYLLARMNKKEVPGVPYPKYGGKSPSGPFHWEYIPLSGIVLIIIFGEMFAALSASGHS